MAKPSLQAYKSGSQDDGEGLECKEKVRERTITTMAESRREIGEQMNWTISLRARAEGQALCKTEKDVGTQGLRQRGRLEEIRRG